MTVKTAFAVLLMVSLLGIAACSDGDADEGGTTASPDVETTSMTGAGSDEPILIKTHLAPRNAQGKTSGEVLSVSTISDSAFCARGRFTDGLAFESMGRPRSSPSRCPALLASMTAF